MSTINATRGVDVLQDWDNFFANKMLDYFTVREEVVGEWFTVHKSVVSVEAGTAPEVLQAINSSKLPLMMSSIRRDVVMVGVIAGPEIKGNPYNLTSNRIFIVDVYDKTKGMYYSVNELVKFVNMLSVNPYGTKYTPGPVIGLIDFKAAVQAVKALPDGASTEDIENQVLSSMNMLLHTPSAINPLVDRQGLLFAGLYGYTFNYN